MKYTKKDLLGEYSAAADYRHTGGQASAINVAQRIDEANVIRPDSAHHEMIVSALSQLSRAVQMMDNFVAELYGDVCDVVAAEPKGCAIPTLHHTLRTTPAVIMEHVDRLDELREKLGELLYGNRYPPHNNEKVF